ncbi:MAG: sulfur globule protein CV1, partial [Chromatiaceae bacterium]|nr:sulfur globule protein CV1 [Chromatiaceae bacterium]
MKKLAIAAAIAALLGVSASAVAFWGGGPGYGNNNMMNDMFGDGSGYGDFSMNMSGGGRGYGRGYNRYYD